MRVVFIVEESLCAQETRFLPAIPAYRKKHHISSLFSVQVVRCCHNYAFLPNRVKILAKYRENDWELKEFLYLCRQMSANGQPKTHIHRIKMSRFRYPVDTDQFQNIREQGLLYVDKTDMMYDLASK